jgi:hypothetical protein
MSAHDNCHDVGKYNCDLEERLHTKVIEFESGDGHVEAPTGWFIAVDLDVECEGHEHDPSSFSSVAGVSTFCDGSCMPEWDLFTHFGSRWLLLQHNELGFVFTSRYQSEEERDADLATLEREYSEWDAEVDW